MKFRPIFAFSVLLAVVTAPAALGGIYFSDATGLSSPFLGEKGMFDSNFAGSITSDKDKAQLTYINERVTYGDVDGKRLPQISNDKIGQYFTANANLVASNGFATLMKDGGASPEYGLSVGGGWKNILARRTPSLFGQRIAMDWLTLRVGGRKANYKLFDPAASFADQVKSQRFKTMSVEVSYAIFVSGGWIAVASTGSTKINNYDDLTKVSVDEIKATSQDPTSGTQRQVVNQTAARIGSYVEQDAIPLQASLTWYPKQTKTWGVGGSAFVDAGWRDSKFRGSCGVGAFLARGAKDKPEPLDAVIGLILKSKDTWGDPKKHSFREKLTVEVQTTVAFF